MLTRILGAGVFVVFVPFASAWADGTHAPAPSPSAVRPAATQTHPAPTPAATPAHVFIAAPSPSPALMPEPIPSALHLASAPSAAPAPRIAPPAAPRVPANAAYLETQKHEVHAQIAEQTAKLQASGKPAALLEPVIHQVLERMSAPAYGMPVIVNEAGERVVRVYHGGTIAEGAPFDLGSSNEWSGPKGIYFTTDKALAEEYALRGAAHGQGGRVLQLDIPASHFEPNGARTRLDAFNATKVANPASDHSVMDLVLASYDGAHRGQWGVFTDMDYANALPRTTVKAVTSADYDAWMKTKQTK